MRKIPTKINENNDNEPNNTSINAGEVQSVFDELENVLNLANIEPSDLDSDYQDLEKNQVAQSVLKINKEYNYFIMDSIVDNTITIKRAYDRYNSDNVFLDGESILFVTNQDIIISNSSPIILKIQNSDGSNEVQINTNILSNSGLNIDNNTIMEFLYILSNNLFLNKNLSLEKDNLIPNVTYYPIDYNTSNSKWNNISENNFDLKPYPYENIVILYPNESVAGGVSTGFTATFNLLETNIDYKCKFTLYIQEYLLSNIDDDIVPMSMSEAFKCIILGQGSDVPSKIKAEFYGLGFVNARFNSSGSVSSGILVGASEVVSSSQLLTRFPDSPAPTTSFYKSFQKISIEIDLKTI